MLIGSCRVELVIPMAASLKDKRRVIKSLLEKSKLKFNIAAAEVDQHDLWKNATLAFVSVSNERLYLERLLDKLLCFVENFNGIEVTGVSREFL